MGKVYKEIHLDKASCCLTKLNDCNSSVDSSSSPNYSAQGKSHWEVVLNAPRSTSTVRRELCLKQPNTRLQFVVKINAPNAIYTEER